MTKAESSRTIQRKECTENQYFVLMCSRASFRTTAQSVGIRRYDSESRFAEGLLEEDSVYQFTASSNDPSVGDMKSASESSLVPAAQSGGHGAYGELWGRHREMIFRIVQRIVKNREDAEDVLQDTWIKAFLNISAFDGRSAFSTWVTRIAINSALMKLRKRRWHMETSLDDHGDADPCRFPEIAELSPDPEEDCIRRERQFRARRAVQRLSPNLRKVIELRLSMDGSIEEIASITGISAAATKSRLLRARLALRKRLERL
jgi:RNA polymerase sigma factor (sigma-70 family)